jgi:LCP family protein required for cell wall assembly
MTVPKYSKYTVHDTWGHRLLRGLCSCLVPGTGQLLGGARKRGYILLGTTVAITAALVLVVLSAVENVDQILAWLLSPSNLLALLIIDVVLVGFRVYAVADAVWLRRTRWGSVGKRPEQEGEAAAPGPEGVLSGVAKWKMPVAIAGLAMLLAFTALPHVWVGYQYVWKFRDLLSTVFAPPTTTTTIATTTTLAGSGTTVSTEPANTTTTAAPVKVDAGADGRLTILFLGSDAGVGRVGARSDATIVGSFDLNTGRIALFSLPRNAGNVPLSEKAQKALRMKVYPNLFNGLYGAAWKAWKSHPELAPEGGDPGAEVVSDTVSLILGIPVDYYAVVDMLGLVNLVDVMGGVDVYFDKPLHASISPPTEEEETLVYDFKEGINHLDGRMALTYARTRHDSDDYTRMGRQRCVIAAMMDQTGMKELVWNFPGIMDVIKNMVRTDIPIDSLQQLVKLRSSLKTDEMISVGFVRPRYTRGSAGNPNKEQNGWVLNQKLIQSTVKQILENPEQFVPTKAGADNGDCWRKPQGQ